MIIKDFIKEKRKRLNLTQTATKDKLGISQGFLADMEKGRRSPSERVVEQMIKVYNLTETEKSEFLLYIGIEKSPENVMKYIQTLEEENKKLKKEIEKLKQVDIK